MGHYWAISFKLWKPRHSWLELASMVGGVPIQCADWLLGAPLVSGGRVSQEVKFRHKSSLPDLCSIASIFFVLLWICFLPVVL